MTIRKGARVLVVPKNKGVWRPVTTEETAAWRASDASKGMTSDGETKLAPRHTYDLNPTDLYTVVRARVQVPRGWRTVGKCAEIADSSGVSWFAYRADLSVVEVLG